MKVHTLWIARLMFLPIAATGLLWQATPAMACRAIAPGQTQSQSYSPQGSLTTFTVGAGTQTESYRGIHGAIAVASNTPDPDPNQLTDRHINVSINTGQASAIHPGGTLLSQMAWQMAMLQELPSGTKTWAHSPTIFFEGLDNVGDFRTTYGAAATQGSYEVSWAGTSPTGRYEYKGWYQLA